MSSSLMVDANVVVFDAAYSNAVDYDDAQKMTNAGENIAIQRGTALLVVEGRQPPVPNDEVPFKMWNMRQQAYRLELVASNLLTPGLNAMLEDAYLNTTTLINPLGTTVVNFTVTSAAGSYAANRFKISFRQAALLPVTFSGISAAVATGGNRISWQVEDEINMRQYAIERSPDGKIYTAIGWLGAAQAGRHEYSFLDSTGAGGLLYYRVHATGIAGDSYYSPVVKLNQLRLPVGVIRVVNPVTSGFLQVAGSQVSPARYAARLVSSEGKIIPLHTCVISSGTINESIPLPAGISKGVYVLQLLSAESSIYSGRLLIMQ